jgi:hypothetical protein
MNNDAADERAEESKRLGLSRVRQQDRAVLSHSSVPTKHGAGTLKQTGTSGEGRQVV